jgi:predicted nucleotide-binding protein
VPQKQKTFRGIKFSPETIKRAMSAMGVTAHSLSVEISDDTIWTFNSDAELDECFAMYRGKECKEAHLSFYPAEDSKVHLSLILLQFRTIVHVRMAKRSEVEGIFHIFEADLEASRIPKDQIEASRNASLKIFVGHGRSTAWRDLKDHLEDKHGYNVIAFETEARGGRHIADILEELEEDASFAIMVMTGENKDEGGTLHARENVIHETGLFQGVLGLRKVVVLLETGCEEFSNRAGVQYIPFAKGNIKEAFGEVLATIRREFGASSSK